MTKTKKRPAANTAGRSERIQAASIPTSGGFMRIRVEGVTPLIIHSFAKKAQEAMLAKQRGYRPGPKPKRQPVLDAVESLYCVDQPVEELVGMIPSDLYEMEPESYLDPLSLDFLDGVRLGMPATAFKQAMVRAGASHKLKMVNLECQLFVHPNAEHPMLVELEHPNPPQMRCDPATIGAGGANRTKDLAFRPSVFPWATELKITYHNGEAALSEDMTLRLLADAGQFVGIGAWRGEKGGTFGSFQITEVRAGRN